MEELIAKESVKVSMLVLEDIAKPKEFGEVGHLGQHVKVTA